MAASLASAAPNGGLLGVGLGLVDGQTGGSKNNSANGASGGLLGIDLNHGKGLDLSKPITADISLDADLSGTVLAAGVLADVAVNPIAHAAAGAAVAIACEKCVVKGDVDAALSLAKVVPALSLSLKDVEVLLDLDVYIGAAATIAVNLVAPAKVSLPLPGLNVDALVYLDLVLGVHTELDLSAGVYVSLPEASLETDILSGDILDTDFSGVAVKVLPIKVRVGCTELLADLRLRVDVAVSAGVDVDDVLPLDQLIPGLHLPSVGAGVEVAVYVNLLEYIGLFCAHSNCPLIKESYGLNVGAAVDVDVAVEDLLSIHLAPTVATALLTIPTQTVCIPSQAPSSVPHSRPTPTGTWSHGLNTGVPTSVPGGSGAPNGWGSPSSYPGGLGGLIPTGGSPLSSGPATTPAAGTGSIASVGTGSGSGNGQTFTVTACAVDVANCPAGFQTTVTLTNTGASTAAVSVPTSAGGNNIATITSQVVTMTPCSSASTFVTPTQFSSAPFSSDVPSQVATATSTPSGSPAGSSSGNTPAGSSSGSSPATSVPAGGNAGGYPTGFSVPPASASSTPVIGTPAGSQPAGGSGSQPTGNSTGFQPAASGYPVGGSSSPSGSTPAGGSGSQPTTGSSGSYPAGGSSDSYPTQAGSGQTGATTAPAGGAPTLASYPVAHAYPGVNSTIPKSWSTSASPATQSGGSYPTGPASTIPTGGAGKLSSSVAAAVALMGAVMAL
ncbi:hypothetical protein F4861DRAFT_550880 [Xylaria intraflava]|nr:hypothetical protein F4861DRAFT_550880 [Xylaria intraflava]